MTEQVIVWSALVVAVMIIGALVFGIVTARMVVLPRTQKTVRVLRIAGETIELDAARATTLPGEYGLWVSDGAGHFRVGEVLDHDIEGGRVVRRVLETTGNTEEVELPARGRWTGHVFASADALDSGSREVLIDTELGPAPAWIVPGGHLRDDVWSIHVHGLGATRVTGLRTVPMAQRLGFTSLIPSFRGDGEGPESPNRASELGQSEWRDVEAALEYATQQGARSIVLIGWSMGAEVSLLLAERSRYRDLIIGMILIGPVTDWRAVIRNGVSHVGLPAALGRLTEWVLGSRGLSRMTGLRSAIDFDALDWTSRRRLAVPCLVVHSVGDEEVPVELTRRFERANQGLVDVVEFPPAVHSWEANLDLDAFDRCLVDWIERRFTPPGGGARSAAPR